MSTSDSDTWFVAYDIRHPRRLRRVHRCLRREGVALQYSAFAVDRDSHNFDRLLDVLRSEIDGKADDLRAYRLPQHCRVWRLGQQAWPDGIMLTASVAVRELLGCVPADLASAEETAAAAGPS